uniref:Uncharacterized protein n=1 Tax=Arundo donax TaxID=35708 RepID=A0A0A8Y7H4_ARUDO
MQADLPSQESQWFRSLLAIVIDLDPEESNKMDASFDAEDTQRTKRVRVAANSDFGSSQFDLGIVHPRPSKKDATAFVKWLRSCNDDDEQLEWSWIIHSEPIEITGASIRSLSHSGALEPDVCNLVMRLFCQLDDKMYRDSDIREPRWRYFLPAEWAALAVEHGNNLIAKSSPAIRSMFSSPHIR